MPGDEKGDKFVSHLAQGNRIITPGRRDEHPEEVDGWAGIAQSHDHHGIDRHVEFVHRSPEPALRGSPGGQPQRHLRGGDHHVECLDCGARQPISISGEIRAEERRTHGLQGDAHHRLIHVDDATSTHVPPATQQGRGRAIGVPHHSIQAGLVESRLHHPALPAPHVAGCRQ